MIFNALPLVFVFALALLSAILAGTNLAAAGWNGGPILIASFVVYGVQTWLGVCLDPGRMYRAFWWHSAS